LGAGAAAGVLSSGLSRLSQKGWIQGIGLGLAFVALPYLHWGLVPMLASVTMIGLFYAPIYVMINSRFQTIATKEKAGRGGALLGLNGALMNSTVALAYAIIGGGLKMMQPALPNGLLPLGLFFALAAALFVLAPKFLPNMPDSIFKSKEDGKGGKKD
jgi:hypothetical protein